MMLLAAGLPRLTLWRNDYMNESTNPLLSLLIWSAVLSALAVLLILGARQSRRRWAQQRSWGLFFCLLRRVKLTWRERLLVWRLARRCQGVQPAAILLAPTALAAAANQWAAQHSAWRGAELPAQLKPIRDKLFGPESAGP